MPKKFDYDMIGALYSRGKTSTQVAERVGCSVATVLNAVHIQGIVRSRKVAHAVTQLTIEQREEARSYRVRGWAWIKIATVMHLSAKTLIKQCVGLEFDKLTNCAECNRVIVNAHRTQKYCDDCGPKIKSMKARFYNEQYQKKLNGEIEAGEPGARE